MWVRSLRLGHTNFQPYRSTDKRVQMLTIIKRWFKFYRKNENEELRILARERQWVKNHERMHAMSVLTNTAYTTSDLYADLYAGAPE